MWTDGIDTDLDVFALSIGLKKEWSQESQGALSGRFYHYDLRPSKRIQALKVGAQEMALSEWIALKSGKAFCKGCSQIKPIAETLDMGGGAKMRFCADCKDSDKAAFMRRMSLHLR